MKEKKEVVYALIEKAIKTENYNYIREAEQISFDNGFEMCLDDEYTFFEDDVWYHKNVNEWNPIYEKE